jgi:cytochrome c oxidase cbb3-type subunit IV
MKQEVLTLFPWPWLPTIGLLIFFIFFVGLIVRVSMKSRQSIFVKAEVLPLDDGDKIGDRL